jgi:mRNA interferase MazF
VRRGEVWWAELPQPIGRRPVALLSRDAAYRVRTSVTVGMVTRTIPQDCVVNLDDILTIPKLRLAERITTLYPQKMTAIARCPQHLEKTTDNDNKLPVKVHRRDLSCVN